jgi:Sigma-70, region 4
MSPLQALAPDQRAVLELLLRQGRSYGELSELLAIPEDAVRARARAALENLAPDHAAPAGEAARITDWLLGQQDAAAAAGTEATVAGSAAAREWAGAVAERLREVDASRVPEVPGPAPAAEAAAPPPPRPRPVRDGVAPRPRPVRAAKAPAPPEPPAGGTAPAPAATAAPAEAPPAGAVATPRSSKLGGAVLLGILALLVAGLLIWLLARDDDETPTASRPAATATATATPQVVNEVALSGTGDSEAQGLMRVFRREEDGRLVFALAAEGVPRNEGREVYAVWFTKQGGGARRLGFAQSQVGEEGVLSTGGPQPGDEAKLARWLVDYDTVLVTRERSATARRPGPAILRGTLPGGGE